MAILENWLHAISNLRNCCAHHSRTWNRRFMVSVTLPYNTLYPFMDRIIIREIRTNKLFATLSCVAYILDIISPGSDFRRNVKELLKSDCRLLDLKDMGFPKYWQSLPVWRENSSATSYYTVKRFIMLTNFLLFWRTYASRLRFSERF